ncbi:hypothetical protein [Mesorhizobium sp. WSM4884]|nr:hypothetical protein [Mesorhizobium sp. WSM4884]MDG4885385.1 hypothetical protein [Mesorhizobium sp. WSM4884]
MKGARRPENRRAWNFRDRQLRCRTLDKRGALANPAVTEPYTPGR